ncbi:tolloid-like protein 1 isoform X3 [Neocloeon triangulifer]|uniref:tolloid-like protein 1 isoform X3 n=1 Tax=Neocloeon triangulifer TaxID=2078957 RepID=UPI00286F6B05|nr:tolloid-like protein 1 isoform X3 [Neocloeon triangulifer]
MLRTYEAFHRGATTASGFLPSEPPVWCCDLGRRPRFRWPMPTCADCADQVAAAAICKRSSQHLPSSTSLPARGKWPPPPRKNTLFLRLEILLFLEYFAMASEDLQKRLSLSIIRVALPGDVIWRPFLVLLVLFSLLPLFSGSECDRTFVSRPGAPQNGTFEAPTILNPTNQTQSRQCIYTFIAGPRQRVEVGFTSFGLRGTPPDGSSIGHLPACVHEYIDLYVEIKDSNVSDLINSPFGGRYCGPIAPRRRISLYRTLALGFFTDKNATYPDLFGGTYSFINDSEYEVGTPEPNTPCTFTVHTDVRRTGNIISPTYPGVYPKDLTCSYQFIGKPGQRVRLEFRDFDLFFGGPHCPFDYVKVYDGLTNESATIGTYCGQQRNLVLYSSESSLFVSFVTLQRTANTQNRGFKGIFEFSESFVKLDFIKSEGEHIRGSECDQKILSKKESRGIVYSPNYPFPYIPKIVCRYFIYGMQDMQHLERVRLSFDKFEIPRGQNGECSDGYLKIYLKGQETMDAYDKYDHEFCGEMLPAQVVSDGPRLVMVFSSGEVQGRGFKAKYTFETEYRIPGTAAPDGSCTFTYRSTSRKRGEFNSPRYPSNYPSGTNCTYIFIATPNEQVNIVFDHFKVRADSANTTHGSYGHYCQEDWLEIYNMYKDGTEKLVGRYCGVTAPGPVESNRGATGLKVLLHSDDEGVFSGFKARYMFEVAKSIFGDCGSNVSSQEYGVITSPNWPNNYEGPERGLASRTCNWYLSVRPRFKILLNFEAFAVEGDPQNRGCPAAVVRIWRGNEGPPLELCGEKLPLDRTQFTSENHVMRISFISADKSVGAVGFRAVWTEMTESPGCDQFQCSKNGFCISERLRCNNVDNCGFEDRSDETNCHTEPPFEPLAMLGAGIGGAVVFILAFCIWCHRKRKRRRRQSRRRRLQRGSPGVGYRGSLAGSLAGSMIGNLAAPSSLPPSLAGSLPPSLAGSRRSMQHVCDAPELHYASSVDSV